MKLELIGFAVEKAVEKISKCGIEANIIYTKSVNKVRNNYTLARVVRYNFTGENTVTIVAAFFPEESIKGYPVGE